LLGKIFVEQSSNFSASADPSIKISMLRTTIFPIIYLIKNIANHVFKT